MHETGVIGSEEPVRTIKTAVFIADFLPHIQHIMQAHGGLLEVYTDHCLAHFPPGTTKIELWPRVESVRYRILFPDGYDLQEVVTRRGDSLLRFSGDDFPEELRKRYPERFGIA